MFHSLILVLLWQMPVAQAEALPALYVIENVPSNRGVVETRRLTKRPDA
jgi:hypothetical protein